MSMSLLVRLATGIELLTRIGSFQANEMQLSGPVPWQLYHRFVEFKPVIGSMFSSAGLRGKILNKALHKQHRRIYNFNRSTEYGHYEACTEAASLQFLRLAHFDEGGRVFTYVITLDGLFRFTETGKEFGIDLLSKHTMHSDVDAYVAFSGEFLIRRLQHADASEDADPKEKTHPQESIPGGPPNKEPPSRPSYYQLIIDNDSGTYRPDKSLLPVLKGFLQKNFPSMGVVAMHWEDEGLQKLKGAQRNAKKEEGNMINMVLNRSQSSISSVESELQARDGNWEQGHKSKREAAYEAIEDPKKLKETVGSVLPTRHEDGGTNGESSKT